jgi:hypothetical protein
VKILGNFHPLPPLPEPQPPIIPGNWRESYLINGKTKYLLITRPEILVLGEKIDMKIFSL